MNTLAILAMALIIYLFGGYADKRVAHPTSTDEASPGQKATK
jgi:hypothetical protein